MKKMYERGGQVVFLRSTLADGSALVADAYEVCDYEGDCELYPSDTFRIVSADTLFDKPPRHAVDEQIKQARTLLDEINNNKKAVIREYAALQNQVDDLQARRDKLLTKAGLSQLDMFINGGITHYVEVRRWSVPRILAFSDTKSEYSGQERGLGMMRLLTLFGKSNGDLEWNLNRYSDGSSSSAAVVIPCTSLEEAQRVLREQIVAEMQTKVNDDLLKCALDAGVEVPQEYTDKLNAEKRKQAQKTLDKLKADLAVAQATLDQYQGEGE